MSSRFDYFNKGTRRIQEASGTTFLIGNLANQDFLRISGSAVVPITQEQILMHDVTGNLTGNVFGDVFGNITGNVNSSTTITGITTVSNPTQSTSSVNGALVVSGGVGIAKDLNVGGNLTIEGTTTLVESTTVLIADNVLVLNSGPGATKDAGYLIQRFQTENDSGTGDVVNDVANEIGSVSSGSGTEITLDVVASGVDDQYVDWWIQITGGTGTGQVRQVTDYDGITKVATISGSGWTVDPDGTSTYGLYPCLYVGSIFNEDLDEWTFGCTDKEDSNNIDIIRTVDVRATQFFGNLDGTLLGDTPITGNLLGDVCGNIYSNFIFEKTPTNGVNVDGVLIKDGEILGNIDGTLIGDTPVTGNIIGDVCGNLYTDAIFEKTLNAGVTIDDVIIKDSDIIGNLVGNVTGDICGNLYADNIFEKTSGAGVTIDGLLIKDGAIPSLTSMETIIGSSASIPAGITCNYPLIPLTNFPMISSGSVISFGASSLTSITMGNLVAEVTINNGGTGASPSITLNSGTQSSVTTLTTDNTFGTGDRVGMRFTTTSDWSNTGTQEHISVIIRYKLI